MWQTVPSDRHYDQSISCASQPVRAQRQGSTETRNPHTLLQIPKQLLPNLSHAKQALYSDRTTHLLTTPAYTLNFFFEVFEIKQIIGVFYKKKKLF